MFFIDNQLKKIVLSSSELGLNIPKILQEHPYLQSLISNEKYSLHVDTLYKVEIPTQGSKAIKLINLSTGKTETYVKIKDSAITQRVENNKVHYFKDKEPWYVRGDGAIEVNLPPKVVPQFANCSNTERAEEILSFQLELDTE